MAVPSRCLVPEGQQSTVLKCALVQKPNEEIAGEKKTGASSRHSWKESPLFFLRIVAKGTDLPSLDLT